MRVGNPVEFGQLLRERRRVLELDQSALSARIGVNRQWVIDLEKGRPGAGLGLVLRAVRELGLELDVQVAPPKSESEPTIDLNALIDRARGKQ